ncbi:MAG: hypothetical protein ACJAZY_001423 [Spirosomataceae bacterium]|jgi:uncharacterized protein YbbC (DUF1343 family)
MNTIQDIKYWSIIFLFALQSCNLDAQQLKSSELIVGAERLDEYLPLIKGKRVALVVNQSSLVNDKHLVDVLLKAGVDVKKVFAPEHGFRGEASAGEKINDQVDQKTGLPITSLYGKNKKPSVSQLADVDVVIFDIQDVGVRFYTYISTMYYSMQACAENNKQIIILDRPNPNGHYVAGPVLEEKYTSFVGIIPIPVVHGCTVGELAKMINGENWLKDNLKADLQVISCENYTHQTIYDLPIKPSPNLPNRQSILLYPSICFFEPTNMSVGRGTDTQFQVIGTPQKNMGDYVFTPEDKPGAVNPPLEGKTCYGLDLRTVDAYNQELTLSYLVDFYGKFDKSKAFFTNEKFFNLLMGNDWVLAKIKAGKSADEIESMWQSGLEDYKELRKGYLLYSL